MLVPKELWKSLDKEEDKGVVLPVRAIDTPQVQM